MVAPPPQDRCQHRLKSCYLLHHPAFSPILLSNVLINFLKNIMSLDPLKLSNQLCFPIYSLSKTIINHYRPLLKELDLTYPQYLVMLVLWEQDQQTVGKLGERLQLDTGTLTPLLKRLEIKGLIHRERTTQDERVVEISLTLKGDALKNQAAAIPSAMLAAMQLDDEAINLLQQVAQKLCPSHATGCSVISPISND